MTINDALSMSIGYLPVGVWHSPLKKAIASITPFFSSCCSSYYLEWHCGQPLQTDLLCSLLYANRTALLRQTEKYVSGSKTDSRWRNAIRFLDSWEKLNTALAGAVPHIWLAGDFDRTCSSFTPPNIHCCIDKRFRERDDNPGYRNRLSARRFDEILDTVRSFGFPELHPAALEPLRKCFRNLGTGAEVLHLSIMHHRTPPMFKLNCILPVDSLPKLPDTLGWKGDIDTLVSLCRELAPSEQRIKGNLCFTTGICHHFELELEYNAPLENDPRRTAMLTALQRRGCISEQQATDLARWSGRNKLPASHTASSDGFLERWLDMKVITGQNGTVTAKAYLGFSPLPRLVW